MKTDNSIQVKGKLTSEYDSLILRVIDILRDAFTGNISISRIIESDNGGFHCMFTIYLKGGDFQ